ncbi:MAG TPA: hypothetical protein PLD54_03860, partial [Candidatus Levybacteria bacterium]|nr:hypothetical protein [Candidatus Levybacteria bacterium]
LEDWSHPIFFSQIEQKGILHGDRFVKVFATADDPRIYTPKLVEIFESSGDPFQDDEVYPYEGRGLYAGKELESYLRSLDLSVAGQHVVRALFRFANNEIGIIPNIMQMKEDGEWVFNHPFDEIDGLKSNKRYIGNKELDIHIDIFHPTSLELLNRFVDFHDPEAMLSFREGRTLRQHLKPEGSVRRSKEW